MSLTTNSMPSLRQRQINEVLDYHQNMNHIVFNRTARHVAVSEQPSGEVDPSQTDIIIEGTIRDRIDNILSSIQKLNQTIAYSTDVQKPDDQLDGGSGRSDSRKGISKKQQAFIARTKAEAEAKAKSVSSADSRGTSSSSATPINRSGFTVPGFLSSAEIAKLNKDAVKAQAKQQSEGLPTRSSQTDSDTSSGTSSSSSSGKTREPDTGTVQSLIKPGSKGSTVSVPMKGSVSTTPISPSVRARINQAISSKVPSFTSPQERKTRSTERAEQSSSLRSSSLREESGASEKKGAESEEEDDDRSEFYPEGPDGSVDREGYYEDLERLLDEQEESDGRDGRDDRYREQERRYAQSGTKVVSRAPGDVRVTSKIKSLIDNSLASILSGYNSLVDYVKLQQQQRPFSSKDTQVVSGLLQSLVEPLKQVIVSALSLRYTDDGRQTVEGQIEYTRVYNVLKDIIQKIQDSAKGGPLIKSDPNMLTEKIPLRQDIMDAPDYDAFNVNTYPYLDKLNDMIETERTKVEAYKVHSDLERDGQHKKLQELDKVQQSLERAGYPINETQKKLFIKKTEQRIRDITTDSIGKMVTRRTTIKGLKDEDDANRELVRDQIRAFRQKRDEYYVRAPSDDKGNIKENVKIRKMEKRIEKLQSMVDNNTFQRSHSNEIQRMINELDAIKTTSIDTVKKARDDISAVKKSLVDKPIRHKQGSGFDDFGDDAELAPYLTKHLKPMMKTTGGKKPKAQAPPFQMRKEQDLWFM